jgi:glucoamylase
MRFTRLSTLSLALGSTVLAGTAPTWLPSPGADKFQLSEYPIAKAGILANIGDKGSKDQGANKGVVIASPSKVDPDYVYT